jgi:hypothetical protein
LVARVTGFFNFEGGKFDMVSSAPNRTTVFISYSHEDAEYFSELSPHLEVLEKNKLIEFWADTKINPGEKWQDKIEAALTSAKIAILLISVDFLNSQFITDNELPPLLAAAEGEGVKILPVILRPCILHKNLSRFRAINSPSRPLSAMEEYEREEIWVKVVEAITEAMAPQHIPEDDSLEKKNNSGKYYIYASDTKVDMLYPQIPTNIRRKLASELDIDLKFIDAETSGTIKKVESAKTRSAKIQLVTKYIENNFDVGTIETPGTYFKGTLSMRWGPLTTDKNVVYFGGLTDRTVVGLGGSMYHIIGRNQGKSFSPPSMSPLLFLWDALRIAEEDTFQNSPDQAVNPMLFAHPIDLVAHLTLNMNMNWPCQQLEFLAKTLLQGPLTKQAYLSTGNLSYIVFGSPIYVAQAD